jgi:hypothetical protein
LQQLWHLTITKLGGCHFGTQAPILVKLSTFLQRDSRPMSLSLG